MATGVFLGILGKWSLIQRTFAALLVFVSDKGGAYFFKEELSNLLRVSKGGEQSGQGLGRLL